MKLLHQKLHGQTQHPEMIDTGTGAQISAAVHLWEESVSNFHTYCTLEQAVKKQIITVFKPMHFDILNDDILGFSNISAREMSDHLFLTYVSIIDVDLEHNFENMRKAWYPQQQVGTLFKQIQGYVDYVEAGGFAIGPVQQNSVVYTKIFATVSFMSACRRCNEKEAADKTWTNIKTHFTAGHRQTKQMQGEFSANSGYHAATAAVVKTEDHIDEAIIEALENLATVTPADCDIVATLTEANARLARQLEEFSKEVKDVKSLLKKERSER
jgi:hypothetical protein